MRARSGFILLCWCVFLVVNQAGASNHQLEVDPSQIPSFPKTCVGRAAARTSVTLRNTTGGQVTVNEITIDQPDGDFEVVGFAEAQTLQQNESLPFQIAFTPSITGVRTGTLKFQTEPGNAAPDDRSLSGEGVTRVLEVVPTSVTFGEQRIGTRSPPKQFSIRNSGSSELTITTKVSGGQASDFRLSGVSQDESLSPGETLTPTITFQPRIAGKRSTTLTITSNACTAATKSVAVTGTGIAPTIRIDPAVLDLGQVPLGTPSERVPLVVSNEGKAPLKVSQIQIVGADASDFAFEALPPLPRTVAAGDSFLLNVIFTPSADGTRRAGARVTSDDPGRPIFEITLTGIGGSASIPPTTSPVATPSPTATATGTSPPPRASGGGGGGDWLAIALVFVLVAGAFAGLAVLKRMRGEQG